MATYQVTVFTTDFVYAATFNNVYIKLVGADHESDRSWLLNFKGALNFVKGAVSLECPSPC